MAETIKTPASNTQSTSAKSTSKSNVKKIILIVIGVLIALIIIIAIAANSATSAPAKVSNDLVSYIKTTDTNSAYNLFSDAAKEVTSEDALRENIERIGPILTGDPDMQSKEVFAETGAPTTALVVYLIQGSDGNTYKFSVQLVKENDQWKVNAFDSTKQ